MPPADYHRRNPLSLRFTADDQAWLDAQAERTGVPVRALVVAAVRDYRSRVEAGEPARVTQVTAERRVQAKWRKAADAARVAVEAEREAGQTDYSCR